MARADNQIIYYNENEINRSPKNAVAYNILKHMVEVLNYKFEELEKIFNNSEINIGTVELVKRKENISNERDRADKDIFGNSRPRQNSYLPRKDTPFLKCNDNNGNIVEFGVWTEWEYKNFPKFKDYIESLYLGYKIEEILSNKEISSLLQEPIDFINTIKTTSMSKSYKIPLLWAFYNNGNIKLKINEDDIYNSFKEFYNKEENTKDLENQKSTQNYKNWGKKEYIKLAKDNPIKHLADKTSKYFYKENDLFCISEILEPYIHKKEFIQEFKDAIQSLENRYVKRETNNIKESDNKYMELKSNI